MRTFGIEEELLLLDPRTREVVAGAPRVLKEFREHGRGRLPAVSAADELTRELFRHQIETRTDPTREAADAFAQLVAVRRTAGEAARAAGLAIGASAIVPLRGDRSVVTADDRYRDMVDTFGEIARTAGTCGMHVHVGIDSDDEGVAVIDRLAPWLPTLLAISANSPFVDGRDTGYASWRAQVWSRWPSAGPTEPFGTAAGYRAASTELIASGAARDAGMLYYDARLAVEHPTVEVRVCDVCAEPADALLVAVLVRALVETLATEWAAGDDPDTWRVGLLRAAHWRAARYGLSDTLLHPVHREPRPAREVLRALVDRVGPALEGSGDLTRVVGGVERVLRAGGAARQRAAFERTGEVAGVVDDLIARTEASWDAQDLS